MSADIYELHQTAFKSVAAYVVTNAKGERVATVAFKYAASGLRTTCYFHVLGTPMVRAYASGGGYDKCSAAIASAARKVQQPIADRSTWTADTAAASALCDAIKDEGRSWDGDLRAAGFNVLQAV